MLRVAYDVTVSAHITTGVGVYARSLLAALRARPVDLRLLQHPLVSRNRRLHRLANGARLARWFTHGVHRELDRQEIAAYHSTTSIGPLRRRRPIVITVHDATQHRMPVHRGRADRAFQWVFRRQAARRADAVLTPSRAAAEAIEDAYRIPASRIRVCPLGVDEGFRGVQPADIVRVRERYGLPFPYLLYVGAQPPRKNLHRLVAAFAGLASLHPDVHLVLVGPANRRDRSLADAVAARGVGRRTHQREVTARADLPAVYAGAACVAYVSLDEGFGLPIVEAMAAGTPVVTSDRSSMPEVAGDAAVLVEPTSTDAIAGGIDRVLSDNRLACDLRRRGRLRSLAFDWSATAAITEQTYRDVTGR